MLSEEAVQRLRQGEPGPLQGSSRGRVRRHAAAQRHRQGGQARARGGLKAQAIGRSLTEMAAKTTTFDLAGLRLGAGEGRAPRLEVCRSRCAGRRALPAAPGACPSARRLAHDGWRLRSAAALHGDARGPVHALSGAGGAPGRGGESRGRRPGAGEELQCPYVRDEVLDLATWARDAFALAAPVKVLCREDCAGLCPVCAADLNEAPPGHHHDAAPDPAAGRS